MVFFCQLLNAKQLNVYNRLDRFQRRFKINELFYNSAGKTTNDSTTRDSLLKRERISSIDLLMLTSSDQPLFILKNFFLFFQSKVSWQGGKPYLAFPFGKSSLAQQCFTITRERWHDTQHNDILQNDNIHWNNQQNYLAQGLSIITQHQDTQHNDNRHSHIQNNYSA